MKFETSVVATSKGYQGIVTRFEERLFQTAFFDNERAAFEAAETWLYWYVNVPTGTVNSIYYILEIPETWPGPHPDSHQYSGLRLKIGRTKNVETRLSNLKTGSSAKLVLHALEPGDGFIESARHKQFASDRRGGEWFACSPALTRHVMDTWYRNRALPPEHQEEVLNLHERIRILRSVRAMRNGSAPDMVNPSLNEPWHGFVFVDLVYANPTDE